MKTKIKIFTILAFVLFASVFLASKGSTQTKTETAGQRFKSIRVLNDMPADQMGKVMNMMAASLGVDCKFCHASNSADFEKEGFEHKDAARQMLKMTFEINRNYFEGRPEISCNSCHQGRPHPRAAIDLSAPAAEKRPAQPERKPALDEILAKYETALGGKANLAKITSRRIRARRIEADEKTFEDEEILQKGDRFSVRTTYVTKQYGNYVVEEVFDGRKASKFGGGAKIELKPDEIEQIKREAQLFANSDLRAVYPKMEFRFVEKLNGREVYQISAAADGLPERLYFDAETGLLVRRVAQTPTVLGSFQYQVDYLDYKDFGGVRLPTVIKFAVPNIRWTRRILDVRNNAEIDDLKFTKQ